MARDEVAEPANPAVDMLRGTQPSSPIALERERPGPPSPQFIVAAAVIAVLVLVVGLLLSGRSLEPAETAWAPSFVGLADVDVQVGRMLAATGAALSVGAAAGIGRRFAHSDVAGLLCAALVALDPALLASSRLAIPDTLVLAGLLWALAFALSPKPALHWAAGGALAFAALLEPASLLWALPLALLLVLRGHIYASPEHLGLAGLQVGALPAGGALLHWFLDGTLRSVPACLDASRIDVLLLRSTFQAGPETLLLHGPVTWLAGAGVLALAGGGALGMAMLRHRAARVPGRLQLRVVVPFHPFLARGLWLLLLAALAPTPLTWLALFAAALALGALELAEDAPGFGLAIGAVLLAFAGLVLLRSWEAVAGSGGEEGVRAALDLVPWTRAESC